VRKIKNKAVVNVHATGEKGALEAEVRELKIELQKARNGGAAVLCKVILLLCERLNNFMTAAFSFDTATCR